MNADPVSQLHYLLAAGNLRGALRHLNDMSPYRFTALYRFGENDLQNLLLIDRQHAAAPTLEPVPVDDSYCTYVQRSRDAFIVEDAASDVRVEAHPKRPVVQAYCGIPLRDANGTLFGTICHFDFEPVPASDHVLALMREVATALDPAAAQAAEATAIEGRVALLGGMLELLADSYEERDGALAAFEDYAAPLREIARARLSAVQADGLDARLLALADALRARPVSQPPG